MAPLPYRPLVAATLALLFSTPLAQAKSVPKVVTAPPSPMVDLGYAVYEGTTLAAGVNQFLGIRFAEPPTGGLRWRAPRDPGRESGVKQSAKQFGPICPGVPESSLPIDQPQSEDCLFMNVFAPSDATETSKLPVWVFIQGGGYATNANPNYNGTEVVTQSGHGLVTVNFNYRVGLFGFLASEKVRADGDLNVGLLDQRKALEWVQKYIHLFGGDPNHVVIHGASAGAGSVAYHLTAYGGRDDGLFIGAAPESPFFPTSRTVEESEFQYDRLLSDTGCADAESPLTCLRTLDFSSLQKASVLLPLREGLGKPKHYFLPVVDGDFSQDHMYTQFAEGRFIKVPLLVGGDTNEGDTFIMNPNATTQEMANSFIHNNWPNLSEEDIEALSAAHPPHPRDLHEPYWGQGSDIYGNMTFACGGLLMSAAASKYVGADKSWNYRYNVKEPYNVAQGKGATHTSETPAIWGVGMAGNSSTSLGTYNAPMVPVIMNYYISFVKTLNPNTLKSRHAPVFEGFGTGDGERMLLEMPLKKTGMEPVLDAQVKTCKMIIGLAAKTEQ
ncbi:related to triacylglycerol lipase II precursor [Cephalotrichum gorgonifer]|uniref:Carboxylic ester hydrolase n=1 Tax=Cephalotrichum gorgonifer TaxID=2041049 RepID=A0AAE8MPA2_9PEZI|nr:related to triacylglycerol lipase II precursor [Cephalotrichum gorgonifer]